MRNSREFWLIKFFQFGESWTELNLKKGERVSEGKFEKYSVRAIADAVSRSGLESARVTLAAAIGAVLSVSGNVQKVVRRDLQFKLVIEPGDVPGFVVFAGYQTIEAEKVKERKIRKGSVVSVRGKLLSFGVSAVCLGDCRLIGESREKAVKSCNKLQHKKNRKGTGEKPQKTSEILFV